MLDRSTVSPNLTDRGRIPAVLRFCTELVGWVTAPWALAHHSVLLAIASLIVLIGVPAVFATPGDKKDVMVPVPGYVTIGFVFLELLAAVFGAWAILPVWAAVVVSVLALVTVGAELPRLRWLLRA
ncbi:hypothetical protein GPX89_03950 [Nocardia sp. ET3-3]|uniref:DUF2568 domain-containing protein n=1 Tax=Nocardia terrae TaxID=2675851 RepID=A0A7K1UPX3_9NOCA|nr:hypothetical protein [Nocardia terrae]MVU76396.1 hypothetical protein [Nocardia terrae]